MKAWLAVLVVTLPGVAAAQACSSDPRPIEEYCVVAGVPYCELAHELLGRAVRLSAEVERCGASSCPVEQAIKDAYEDRLIRHAMVQVPLNFPKDAILPCLDAAKASLKDQARAAVQPDRDALRGDRGDDVERKLAALEERPPAERSPDDLAAAARAGDDAYALWRRLSLEVDQREQMGAGDDGRETVNAFAARLAGWRDRLIKLYREAGMPAADPLADAPGGSPALHAPAKLDLARFQGWSPLDPRPLSGPPVVVGRAEGQSNPYYRSPTDELAPGSRELVRAPAPRAGAVPALPPSLYGLEAGSFERRPLPTQEAEKLSRTFTRVVGDPRGRAALVHEQVGDNCSVVAQQQILEAAGAARRGGGRELEGKLSDQTWERGYRSPDDKGTFIAFNGNLLHHRGFLVEKHLQAGAGQLAEAAATGRLLAADMDPAKLWRDPSKVSKDPSKPFSHSVLVTGARLDLAGHVVGYYINDSAIEPGGQGGRYMTAAEFMDAWRYRYVDVR